MIKYEEYFEKYREEHNIPTIEDYGMGKNHYKTSQEIYDYISKLDFGNGDYFRFRSGGDADNGEFLMDLLDKYFEGNSKQCREADVQVQGCIKDEYKLDKEVK